MNSKKYISILKKKVKELENLYPNGITWQQDGSPVHKSKEFLQYLKDSDIVLLNFPPYSPDISPIENIWGWLKHEVSNDQP